MLTQSNRDNLLKLIEKFPGLSKHQLSKLSNLSMVTLFYGINQLEQEKLVKFVRKSNGRCIIYLKEAVVQ